MATWTPTPEEVKALIPTRLDGEPFSDSSTPSLADVAGQAQDVTAEIIGDVADLGGSAVIAGDDIVATARRAAALGTAAYIESTFFPEQSESSAQSPAQVLFGRFEEAVARLRRQITAANVSGTSAAAETVRVPSAVASDLYSGTVIYYPGVYSSGQLV